MWTSSRHVGTREVMQDMDVMRAVLGDPKLNYLGYSYGTRLGSAYAETFPQNVRALVLDGALDPAQDPVAGIAAPSSGLPGRVRRLRRRLREERRLPARDRPRPGGGPLPASWSTR